jgi:hypothetical protein
VAATKTKPKAKTKDVVRKPPEPRGRRGHKAVDEQPGLREWLIERIQQVPRPTLDVILVDLEGTGFSIGRTAVWKFRVAWEIHLAERDLALRQAQDYASLDSDQPLTLEKALSTMGNVAIMNDVRARLAESGGTVTPPIAELLNLAARMQTSAAQRERTNNQIERGVRRAMNRMRLEMEDLLKREPQAMKIVLAAMRDASRKELQA